MIIKDKDLPNGWEWVSLGDICKIETGTTPSRAKPEFFGEGLPWVTPGDFDGSTYISKGREAITELGIREGRGKVFPSKTVLLVCIGTIGKVAVAARKISANQQINSLICGSKIYPEFLYFYLVYNKANLVSIASSSTVPIINQERLGTIEIPLPPLSEQKRIAAIAQKADRLRRSRRYALQLSDTYLRSVFLEMFGDPLTNPKEWKIQALGDLLSIPPHIGTITPAQESGNQLCVRVGEVGEWYVDLNSCKYVSLSGHALKRFSLLPGDIVLARAIGSESHLGKLSIVGQSKLPVVFDSHLMRLRLDKSVICPEFFVVWMQTPGGRARFMQQARRTAIQFNINGEQIAAIAIPLPSPPLQEKFAQIAQKFDRLRTQQREADRQAEHLFQTILHRAFRGELTSQNADDEPESVLLQEIRAQQAKAEAEAKTATQAMGEAADYLGTKAKQQDIEPIQLKFPGFE